MQRVNFNDFFISATGNTPFPYQQRFANDAIFPKVLHVPTGAGKTAGIILAWVWRRFYHPEKDVQLKTPRRLIYCLPMRVLVEQTRDSARNMLAQLSKLDPRLADISITVLMGGESETDWMLNPEKEQIVIGTQDMLLSAALNRGYAMSRFRWPYAFGLLNNDCLWCFDEVQLMGSGFATSLQLDAFRKMFGTFGYVDSVWMSATLEKQWFYTPDVNSLEDIKILSLTDEDMKAEVLVRRMIAQKTLRQASESLSDLKNKYPRAIAKRVLKQHIPGKLTLVIVNQVERAQKIYRELKKQSDDSVDLILMHSRFRPADRLALNQSLTKPISVDGRMVLSMNIHGYYAVARLRQSMRHPTAHPHSRDIHGYYAVARLRLSDEVWQGPSPQLYPRLLCRGSIAATRSKSLPAAVSAYIHGYKAVAQLQATPLRELALFRPISMAT